MAESADTFLFRGAYPAGNMAVPTRRRRLFSAKAQHKGADTADGRYIVCTSDLVYPDEVNDIHARNKRPIGQRMAAAAATYSYGIPGIPHTYPTFKEMENHGEYALITFDNAWSVPVAQRKYRRF